MCERSVIFRTHFARHREARRPFRDWKASWNIAESRDSLLPAVPNGMSRDCRRYLRKLYPSWCLVPKRSNLSVIIIQSRCFGLSAVRDRSS